MLPREKEVDNAWVLLWTGTIFGFIIGFAVGYYVAVIMIGA